MRTLIPGSAGVIRMRCASEEHLTHGRRPVQRVADRETTARHPPGSDVCVLWARSSSVIPTTLFRPIPGIRGNSSRLIGRSASIVVTPSTARAVIVASDRAELEIGVVTVDAPELGRADARWGGHPRGFEDACSLTPHVSSCETCRPRCSKRAPSTMDVLRRLKGLARLTGH